MLFCKLPHGTIMLITGGGGMSKLLHMVVKYLENYPKLHVQHMGRATHELEADHLAKTFPLPPGNVYGC